MVARLSAPRLACRVGITALALALPACSGTRLSLSGNPYAFAGRGRPGNIAGGYGQIVLPRGTRHAGVTAARPLPQFRINSPQTKGDAIRGYGSGAEGDLVIGPATNGQTAKTWIFFPPGYVLGAVFGAAVGVEKEKLIRSERAAAAALEDAQFENRLRDLCTARLLSAGVPTLVDLPAGTPAEPVDPERRNRNPAHPLQRKGLDVVVGFWFSSLGFLSGEADFASNGTNRPLQLFLTAELSAVSTRDWSSSGGVTFVYRSEARHKFTEWADRDAALLRQELSRFWQQLEQDLAGRVAIAP